jgi:tetratricopeptide (TPR) repeat protein
MKNLLFTLALLVSFNSFSQTSDEVVTKLENGNFQSALIDANSIIKQNPSVAFYYYLRAYTYYNLDNNYNAKKDFLKSFDLGYEFEGAYKSVADIYFTEKNYSQAVIYYKKQLELQDEIAVHYNIAISYYNNEEYNNAIEYFTNVTSINSRDDLVAQAFKYRGRSKNSSNKNGCSDVIKGVDLYIQAMNNKKQWARYNTDIDYAYNSYCVNRKTYNYYFKLWKKALKKY